MFFDFIKEILFPLFCVECGDEGTFLCSPCFGSIHLSGIFACPVCHVHNGTGNVCGTCVDGTHLRSVISAGDFSLPIMGKLVHALKYEFIEDAYTYIEQMINAFVEQEASRFAICEAIVAIPLHKRRFVERGFNQSDMVACTLSKALQKPVLPLLQRKNYTAKQALLSKFERAKNVQDAFEINRKTQIPDVILLVDDVYTTGSTMNSAARVLTAHTPYVEVRGFTFGRG